MSNRLAEESSPYLRQHRDNPVDWHPWGDEAFALAAAGDRPVLVSIGYSACHWCHVMAHESFEDDATAQVMNDLFVNVKVDREERPDVDAIYMEATQAMTGQGGWPMTVFCAPDGRPFYCGTYFPPEPRHGMPSFLDICRAIDDAWRNRRDELLAQASQVTDALGRTALLRSGGEDVPGLDVVERAVTSLVRGHDDAWGGFGRAPKFPQSMSIDTLLRAHLRTGAPEPLAAARTSLDAMAAGGIYDHLGGGFSRYSVDAVWLVPHFEKMLYDQALLARAYLHAWQLTSEPAYRQVVEETIGYVLAELRHPSGGFFSAEDADSEGEEGRFYVWTPAQVRGVLGDEALAAAAIEWYDITEEGNFEGSTILNRIKARGDLLRPPDVEEARRGLFAARSSRVRPGLDDKVLAEWNGLMLATLAEAGAALGRDDWLTEARRTGDFLLGALRRADGRWLRSWQSDAGAKTLAFAADHGALVDAFTRLAEATGEARWIGAAVDTAEALLGLFWDDDGGGVFTTGHDGEQLIARAKDVLDNATPSATSLAAVALLRLGALTGVDRYVVRAEAILALFGPVAAEHPSAFGHLLYAIELAAGSSEVAVVGDRPDLVAAVRASWRPTTVLAWGERYESPLWHGRADGMAYVCRHYACQRPATEPDELVRQLSA
ncbi:MAG: thioredoxin domain-containing protein [Acidimicrobiales bacterium]